MTLVSEGLDWQQHKWPHITSDRPFLSGLLAATCERGLDSNQNDAWFHASLLALRLHHHDHGDDEPIKSLRERLTNLNAEDNARLFWAEDALLQSLHETKDPRERIAKIISNGEPVQFKPDRDLVWVSNALGDTSRDAGERAMLLEVAMRLSPNRENWKVYIEGLRPLIIDEPILVERIDVELKPSNYDNEHRQWEIQQTEHKLQEKQRKNSAQANWIKFWHKIATQPEDAFSPEQEQNSALLSCAVCG